MNIQSLTDGLEQLKILHNQGKYLDAYKLLEKLLRDYPYSVELLVRQGKLIQLLDDDNEETPTLEIARESLKIANLINPESIEASIELGYFEYAINNSSEVAINYFKSARKNAEIGLKSALIGEIKCYIDIDNISKARETIEKAKIFFPDDSDIGVLEFELQEYEGDT